MMGGPWAWALLIVGDEGDEGDGRKGTKWGLGGCNREEVAFSGGKRDNGIVRG